MTDSPFIPSPPRVRGDPTADNRAGLEWQWQLFKAIAVDNTVRIDANQRSGSAVVSGTATTVAVTFTTAMSDSNYRLVASASTFAGSPAAGAFTVTAVAKAATGFVLAVSAAPGAGTSVTFDWIAMR